MVNYLSDFFFVRV